MFSDCKVTLVYFHGLKHACLLTVKCHALKCTCVDSKVLCTYLYEIHFTFFLLSDGVIRIEPYWKVRTVCYILQMMLWRGYLMTDQLVIINFWLVILGLYMQQALVLTEHICSLVQMMAAVSTIHIWFPCLSFCNVMTSCASTSIYAVSYVCIIHLLPFL